MISPKSIALKHKLEVGNLAALDKFWNEIEEKGAPLVESIEDDADYSFGDLKSVYQNNGN